MKNRLFYRYFFCLFLFFSGCASIQSPEGGKKDTTPPRILSIQPPNQTVSFSGSEIIITFSEPIKVATSDKAIHLMPEVKGETKLKTQNRKLILEFLEPLPKNVTYKISFGEVKDLTEGNVMDSVFNYAFSTGEILDSGKVVGKIINSYENKAEPGFFIGLYSKDSIKEYNFLFKEPKYYTFSNKSGVFDFTNLPCDSFYIFGFKDNNSNLKFDGFLEKAAMPTEPEVKTVCSLDSVFPIPFYTTTIPYSGRVILDAQFHNSSTISFGLCSGCSVGSLQINISDTLKNYELEIDTFQWFSVPKNRIFISLKDTLPAEFQLTVKGIIDTFGISGDTVLYLNKEISEKSKGYKIFNPLKSTDPICFLNYTPLREYNALFGKIGLTDSIGNKINFTIESGPFLFRLIPDLPELSNSKLLELTTYFKDTISESITLPGVNGKGTISGKTINYQNVIIELIDSNEKIIEKSFNQEFEFFEIEPGEYKLRVILDKDNNKVWTQGSFTPYQLPEPVYFYPATLKLRPNWILEGINIEIPENLIY